MDLDKDHQWQEIHEARGGYRALSNRWADNIGTHQSMLPQKETRDASSWKDKIYPKIIPPTFPI